MFSDYAELIEKHLTLENFHQLSNNCVCKVDGLTVLKAPVVGMMYPPHYSYIIMEKH